MHVSKIVSAAVLVAAASAHHPVEGQVQGQQGGYEHSSKPAHHTQHTHHSQPAHTHHSQPAHSEPSNTHHSKPGHGHYTTTQVLNLMPTPYLPPSSPKAVPSWHQGHHGHHGHHGCDKCHCKEAGCCRCSGKPPSVSTPCNTATASGPAPPVWTAPKPCTSSAAGGAGVPPPAGGDKGQDNNGNNDNNDNNDNGGGMQVAGGNNTGNPLPTQPITAGAADKSLSSVAYALLGGAWYWYWYWY